MTTLTATAQSIETRANQLIANFNLIRFVLIALSVPFVVIGLVARLVFRLAIVVCAWSWAALEAGWSRGAPRVRG